MINPIAKIGNKSDRSILISEMTPATLARFLLHTLTDDVPVAVDKQMISEPIYDYIMQASECQVRHILCAATARLDFLQSNRAN